MSTFEEYVEDVLKDEWMGEEIERTYGHTYFGQEFVFIISKKIWYGVRLIVGEDHRELELVRENRVYNKNVLKKKDFWNLEEAQNYIQEKCEQYGEGYFSRDSHKSSVRHRVRKLPEDVLENPDKYLKTGDHLQRRLSFCPLFFHEGVYLGNGLVAHISNEPEDGSGRLGSVMCKFTARAIIDPIANFVTPNFQSINIVVHCFRRRLQDEICEDALRLVNESYGVGEYDFLQKNCQHFAALCVLGFRWMSDKKRLQKKFIGV